jgi:hypothetical protein
VPWSGAPDCPVCHRTVSSAPGPYNSELFTFGFFQRRSAITHRTVRCTSGAMATNTTVDCNGRLQFRYSARTVRAEVRAAARGAPDCPVPLDDKAPTVDCGRTLTVGWHGWRTGQCPMAHRTVWCAHWQQPTSTVFWWLRAINTPNHLHSNHPSTQHIAFNTRARDSTPKTQFKWSIHSKFSIQL